MNIELIKSDINDALRTAYLLGSVSTGIEIGPGGIQASNALKELRSMNERKVMNIVEDMHHFCKAAERLAEDQI